MVASVMANTIGPTHVANASPGWNSEIWVDHTKDTTYFWIQQCQASNSTVKFDLMHHWFWTPSTGTAERTLNCQNNGTWQQASWANVDTADYSIEYTHNSPATATYWYYIQY